MSTLTSILLISLTTISATLAGVLVWYVRKVLLKMSMLVDSDRDVLEQIKEYTKHLEFVNSLEMFYGDETIAGLLRHSKELSEYLEDRVSEVEIFEDEETDEGEEIV